MLYSTLLSIVEPFNFLVWILLRLIQSACGLLQLWSSSICIDALLISCTSSFWPQMLPCFITSRSRSSSVNIRGSPSH